MSSTKRKIGTSVFHVGDRWLRGFRSLSALLMGCAFFTACTLSAQIVDNFSVSHDYSGGNVAGTIWTGAYTGNNPTSTFDANITNAGQLTMSDLGGHWEGGDNSAHLLYISVTGDFTATVNLYDETTVNYTTGGLGAFADSTLTGGEVSWIGIGTLDKTWLNVLRSVTNGSQDDQNADSIMGSVAPGQFYMQLSRAGDVFTASLSTDGGSTYTPFMNPVTRSDLPSTLDVGLWVGSYSTETATAQFANFSLTTVPEPSTYAMLLGGMGLLMVLRKFNTRKV